MYILQFYEQIITIKANSARDLKLVKYKCYEILNNFTEKWDGHNRGRLQCAHRPWCRHNKLGNWHRDAPKENAFFLPKNFLLLILLTSKNASNHVESPGNQYPNQIDYILISSRWKSTVARKRAIFINLSILWLKARSIQICRLARNNVSIISDKKIRGQLAHFKSNYWNQYQCHLWSDGWILIPS